MTTTSPDPSLVRRFIAACTRIPDSAIALLARFSIAAVFWKSGQTKVEGLAIDLVGGELHLGWPHLSDSAVALFQQEYKLPLLPPELAATLAACAEHVFPVLLLLGLATRLSALGLLGMTLTIQLFVYPDAYPTHGTWAALLLYLVAQGPGKLSVDAWIARRRGWYLLHI
ncbi:DoxX family protein [Rhodoferax sp. WC2427]|uniref:DoxX family protein n=1 Tax=Rhodoferax sp. WC2427 TaxID=3234144 RepID=UPI003467E595